MGTAFVTMGGSEVWRKLKEPLLGKKKEGAAAKYTQLEPEQSKALGIYDEELSKIKEFNPSELAKLQVNQLEGQARAGADDAERTAQSIVAQRGLGKSSVGIGAILGAKRDLGDRISAIRAQEPILRYGLEGEKLNRLGTLSGGINSIFGQRMYTPEVAGGYRQGGLLNLGLGIGGAILAAKTGQNPLVGYQVGSGIGQSIQNYQG